MIFHDTITYLCRIKGPVISGEGDLINVIASFAFICTGKEPQSCELIIVSRCLLIRKAWKIVLEEIMQVDTAIMPTTE